MIKLLPRFLYASFLLAASQAHAGADFGVTVTAATSEKTATFTITNTSSYSGGFFIDRSTEHKFAGPKPTELTNQRIKVTYLLNGSPMTDPTATITLGSKQSATVTLKLRILGNIPLAYKRTYTTTVTATQTVFPSSRPTPHYRLPTITASATAKLVVKPTK